MKEQLKRLAAAVFDDYQLNRIYCRDTTHPQAQAGDLIPTGTTIAVIASREQIAASPDQRIRDHSWYAGEHAVGYGLWQGDQLVCVCWFWMPGRAAMPSRFSALTDREAVMVDLLTAASCRGKGYAVAITEFAAADLHGRGCTKLWTWVWHSNVPSIRVFTKTGWRYSHFLVELRLFGMRSYLRLKLPPIGR